MIRKLEIQNFKSHKHTELVFGNLTVLSGENAVGKSSVLQAILLLREAFREDAELNYLNFRTDSANIGSAKDAIYQAATEDKISFKIESESTKYQFSFQSKDSELNKTVMPRFKSSRGQMGEDSALLANESFMDRNFQFISAARLGPTPFHQKNDFIADVQNQISQFEGRAEYFVHFLVLNQDREVVPEIRNKNSDSVDLFYQTTAWINEISPGASLSISDLGSVGYELGFQFVTSSRGGKTNVFKSINVGFGLSYALPIVVAILAAPRGSLLFIENPEAHIHPQGQHKLAELICLAANAGIQIVIETHSDHIINGILVQSKRFEVENKGINREQLVFYHFFREEEGHSTTSERILIEKGGLIRYAPNRFFDQFDLDRKYLMGF